MAVAALFAVAAAVFGVPVIGKLSAGGFADPQAESTRAAEVLSRSFDQGDMQLLIVVSDPAGVMSPAARRVGTEIVTGLRESQHVGEVSSVWTVPPAAAASLRSRDGTAGLIVAGVTGGDSTPRPTPRISSTPWSMTGTGCACRPAARPW